MHRRDLTPILPRTQYSCIQPTSTTHSNPPDGMSAKFVKLCPQNIPLRASNGLTPTWRVYPSRREPTRIPNLGALPIIPSVSPQPFPCLFACFYDSVSCVCTFFSTCLSDCVVRVACFVFGLYLYVYYSDSSVCVSQQICVFQVPFSSILVHISRHIHLYVFMFNSYVCIVLCYTFLPVFLFSFFFFRS